MTAVRVLPSITAISPERWNALVGDADIDLSHTYLRFREHLEPGAPALLVVGDETAPTAGLHGSLTTTSTGLFSHPWKLLASDQVLRAADDAELAERRTARNTTLDGVVDAMEPEPLWQRLAAVTGPTYVVRAYDSTEVLVGPGVDAAEAVTDLVSLAQQHAVSQGWGAVVFPYVCRDDKLLAGVLEERGFRSATLTGASDIHVGGADSFDEFVGTLPTRRRYRYRKDLEDLDATGYARGSLALDEHLDSIVDMEVQTMVKHGSSPDPENLRAARRFLVEHALDLVRVPSVSDDAGPFACGLHLVGGNSYLTLTFGADYGIERRDSAGAYQWITCYDPVEHACENGLDRIRLGFESFEVKAWRGAVVKPRRTWFWLPDDGVFDAVTETFALVTGYTADYLDRFDQR